MLNVLNYILRDRITWCLPVGCIVVACLFGACSNKLKPAHMTIQQTVDWSLWVDSQARMAGKPEVLVLDVSDMEQRQVEALRMAEEIVATVQTWQKGQAYSVVIVYGAGFQEYSGPGIKCWEPSQLEEFALWVQQSALGAIGRSEILLTAEYAARYVKHAKAHVNVLTVDTDNWQGVQTKVNPCWRAEARSLQLKSYSSLDSNSGK